MFLEKFIFNSLHWLLTPTCVLCGYHTPKNKNICTPCKQNLPRCAQILPNLTFALFSYQPPIIRLVKALKFHQQLSHAQVFGQLLAEAIQCDWYVNQPLPDIIIPIPLHPKRLRERGFNQALEIARSVASILGLPIDIQGVARIKHTLAQSGLLAADRKRNMQQAFATRRDYSGLTIAVVDDVMTTGHTLAAFCEVLKRAGARDIHIWCIASRDIAVNAKTR